jgi:hypothetical protein
MVTGWVNVYENFLGGGIYQTKEEADKLGTSDRIACVKMIGTYEKEINE